MGCRRASGGKGGGAMEGKRVREGRAGQPPRRGPAHPLLLVPVPPRCRSQPRRRPPPPQQQQQHSPRRRRHRSRHPPRSAAFRGGTGTAPQGDNPRPGSLRRSGVRNRARASAAERDPATKRALRREKGSQPGRHPSRSLLCRHRAAKKKKQTTPKPPNINVLHFPW